MLPPGPGDDDVSRCGGHICPSLAVIGSSPAARVFGGSAVGRGGAAGVAGLVPTIADVARPVMVAVAVRGVCVHATGLADAIFLLCAMPGAVPVGSPQLGGRCVRLGNRLHHTVPAEHRVEVQRRGGDDLGIGKAVQPTIRPGLQQALPIEGVVREVPEHHPAEPHRLGPFGFQCNRGGRFDGAEDTERCVVDKRRLRVVVIVELPTTVRRLQLLQQVLVVINPAFEAAGCAAG